MSHTPCYLIDLDGTVYCGSRPIPQAAAAMEAMGLEGEELLLVYSDNGGETVSASWAATGNGA